MLIHDPSQIDLYDTICIDIVNLAEGIVITSPNILEGLRDRLAFYTQNYKYDKRYRFENWDGKKRFIGYNGRFGLGLTKKVIEQALLTGYKVYVNFDIDDFVDSKATPERVNSKIVEVSKECNLPFEAYDHQVEAVQKIFWYKRGIIEAGVGAGKSLIAFFFAKILLKKNPNSRLILIVPTQMLVDQMYDDWAKYGWGESLPRQVERLYDGLKPKFNTEVLITTWQSVYRNEAPFFSAYDAVVVDEAHGIKGAELQKTLDKCSNAQYRIGMTGTYPDHPVSRMGLTATCGELLYSIETQELIAKGVNCPAKVRIIVLDHGPDVGAEAFRYSWELDTEKAFIKNSAERYRLIAWYINSVMGEGENGLVLTDSPSVCDEFNKYLAELRWNKEIFTIHGKIAKEERSRVRSYVSIASNCLINGTFQTMSTGVNVPRLHHLFIISSYGSRELNKQALGRLLRTHESKDFAHIHDFTDKIKPAGVDTFGNPHPDNHLLRQCKKRKREVYDRDGFPTERITYKLF